jgi:hypothetical protein
MTKQEINIFNFFNSKENAQVEEYKNLKIVRYTKGDRFLVAIWANKQMKPYRHFYFTAIEKREKYIDDTKVIADRNEVRIARIKAEKKAFKPELNIGDIYASSWGYEQTNVNFYQVVEVKGKCTIVLREIAQDYIKGTEGNMSCKVTARKDDFVNNELIQKRVTKTGVKLASYQYAYKWDGKPKYKSWYY